jgi:hypothetical protein
MRDAVVERPPSPQSNRARGSQQAVDKHGEDQNVNVAQDVDASQLATAVRAPHQDVYVAEQERTLTTEQLWDELDRLEEAENMDSELSNVCLVAAVTAVSIALPLYEFLYGCFRVRPVAQANDRLCQFFLCCRRPRQRQALAVTGGQFRLRTSWKYG